MTSALTHLECSACATTYDCERLQNLCTCGHPLLARYDLSAVRRENVGGNGIWRWAELLPVRDPAHRVTLGEGDTPLLPLSDGILVKDEGLNPTGSFKARGAAVGASRARELGATHVALPTNGNAGAAWSAYGRRAGLAVTVAVPAGAPAVTRGEALATGAEVAVVDGLIGDAGALVGRAVQRNAGWFDVSTLKEPYRVEGKKTMGLEIAEQLGWRAPDVVVYPTGGGVGMIGIAKAFAELRELGWLTGPETRFVAAQAAGCAPVVRAFEAGAETTEAWPDPHTVAYGITVAAPLGGPQLLRILRGSGGTAVAVTDADALATRAACAAEDGLLLSPEGAVALHAVRRLRAAGWTAPGERVVVLNTGSALIQPETLPAPEGPGDLA
ncbi:MAG TPA: threonine synthase [Mycobacteriales bacterium]|nr:threonine synthase [Mycobacteriales bacterium]